MSRKRRKGILCGPNSGSKSLVSWKNGEEAWGLERSRVGTAVEGDLGGDGRSCIVPGPKEPQWFQAKEEGLIPSLPSRSLWPRLEPARNGRSRRQELTRGEGSRHPGLGHPHRVASGKSLYLSVPPFSYPCNEDNERNYLRGPLRELHRLIRVPWLE